MDDGIWKGSCRDQGHCTIDHLLFPTGSTVIDKMLEELRSRDLLRVRIVSPNHQVFSIHQSVKLRIDMHQIDKRRIAWHCEPQRLDLLLYFCRQFCIFDLLLFLVVVFFSWKRTNWRRISPALTQSLRALFDSLNQASSGDLLLLALRAKTQEQRLSTNWIIHILECQRSRWENFTLWADHTQWAFLSLNLHLSLLITISFDVQITPKCSSLSSSLLVFLRKLLPCRLRLPYLL